METPYTLDDFLIVLVLYRIDLESAASFKSLLNCNKAENKIDLLVYDNSPKPIDKASRTEVQHGFHIQYIQDSSNPGVSKAYNTGVSIARKQHKKWILFLDQDTILDENILSLFLKSTNEQKNHSIFATTLFSNNNNLISPSKYWFKRGFSLSKAPEGKCGLKHIRPINSSVLIATAVFEKAGLYNEKIRLDFSDHEFFDRVFTHYKYMFVVPSNSYHSLSTSDDTNLDSIKNTVWYFL